MALTEEDKKEGRFVRGSQLELADQQAVHGWLKGFPSEVLFVCRVFTNKDDSIGQFGVQRRTSRHPLPKTVESRGVPQVVKIQCGPGKVANPYGHHTEQADLHVNLRGVKAGVSED